MKGLEVVIMLDSMTVCSLLGTTLMYIGMGLIGYAARLVHMGCRIPLAKASIVSVI